MFDRRAERRQATVEEIVATAWRLARHEGLAGLSLRALANEVGMRPQSLYSYFDSKNAIYDAMFAQAAQQWLARTTTWELTGDARTDVATIASTFVEFCTADPVRYQLLFQRTVPGFEPSAVAFAISVEGLAAIVEPLASAGLGDPMLIDLLTAIGTGLTDQQISNDPGGDRWTRLLPDAVEMVLDFAAKRAGSSPKSNRKART